MAKKNRAKRSSTNVKVANKQANRLKRKRFQSNGQANGAESSTNSKRVRVPQGASRGSRKTPQSTKTPKRQRNSSSSRLHKTPKTPAAPVVEEESEVDLSDEDVDFFMSNAAQFVSTSSNVDISKLELSSKKKQRPSAASNPFGAGSSGSEDNEDDVGSDAGSQDASDNELADFERRPRRARPEERKKGARLPVKDADGDVVRVVQPLSSQLKRPVAPRKKVPAMQGAAKDQSDSEPSEDGDVEMEPAAADPGQQAPPQSAAVLARGRELRVARLKRRVAQVCEAVLTDPEKNISLLGELAPMRTDEDIVVQQIAILSATEVFKDIIPGYRIHAPSAEERKKVSKEVRRVWTYEGRLLHEYKGLMTQLIKIVTAQLRGRSASPSKLGIIAATCLCGLLGKAFHFNYRSELLGCVVPLLNHSHQSVRTLVFAAVTRIFQEDIGGQAALEAVRIVAKLVKRQGGRVRRELIDSLLHLPLSLEVLRSTVDKERSEAEAKVKAALPSTAKLGKRKKKKMLRSEDYARLKRDLEASNAEIPLQQRQRIQTQTLTEVFTVYFRLLKSEKELAEIGARNSGKRFYSACLPSLLNGLAKFSSLINLELVLDLLEYLKTILASGLSFANALRCILAAFNTLSAHRGSLNIDMKEYYLHIYKRVWELALPENYEHMELVVRCMNVMLRHRTLSDLRVAAFSKRLLGVAAMMPAHYTLCVVHLVRQLMANHMKCRQLLDTEVGSAGAYLPAVEDPDLANALSSTAWEVSLLQCSYHPFLPKYLQGMINDDQSVDPILRLKPSDLLDLYDTSRGTFNPPFPPAPSMSKTAEKKLRRARKIASDAPEAPKSDFVQQLEALQSRHM